MTDRELLELAAKAAGLHDLTYFDACAAGGKGMRRDELDWNNWNPLEDDGDALALAVRVFLTVEVEDGFTEVLTGIGMAITESHNGDALSATRCAIVRAAAEIGRAMP